MLYLLSSFALYFDLMSDSIHAFFQPQTRISKAHCVLVQCIHDKTNTVEIHRLDQFILDWTTAVVGKAVTVSALCQLHIPQQWSNLIISKVFLMCSSNCSLNLENIKNIQVLSCLMHEPFVKKVQGSKLLLQCTYSVCVVQLCVVHLITVCVVLPVKTHIFHSGDFEVCLSHQH